MRILFDFLIYFMLFTVVHFAHNIISASTMASFQFEHIKNEYFDSVAFHPIYKYKTPDN